MLDAEGCPDAEGRKVLLAASRRTSFLMHQPLAAAREGREPRTFGVVDARRNRSLPACDEVAVVVRVELVEGVLNTGVPRVVADARPHFTTVDEVTVRPYVVEAGVSDRDANHRPDQCH